MSRFFLQERGNSNNELALGGIESINIVFTVRRCAAAPPRSSKYNYIVSNIIF